MDKKKLPFGKALVDLLDLGLREAQISVELLGIFL
jgi:hypothetical protein